MNKMDEQFSARIEELLNHAEDGTVFFFKGFALPQIKQLLEHPHALLKAPELIETGNLDLPALNEKWLELAEAFRSAPKPAVGFYEELLAIRELLPRLNAKAICIVENNALSPWEPCLFPMADALALFDYQQQEKDPVSPELDLLTHYYGDVRILNGEKALVLPFTPEGPELKTVPFWAETPVPTETDASLLEHGTAEGWLFRLELLEGKEHPVQLTEDLREAGLAAALTALQIPFALQKEEPEQEKTVYDEAPFLPLLKKYWGEGASFRPLLFYKDPDVSRETESISQGQIVAEITDQCRKAQKGEEFRNIFITAPTGSGKSILFQLPALTLEKEGLVTIVVSPLIALMNDQVDQLQRRGVTSAACINSTMTMEERLSVMKRIQNGECSLLYLAPELLLTTRLQSFLGGRKVGLFVIDEAHTVTSWGRDFRSDYWFLGDFIKKCRREDMLFPVLCLTATAVYSGEDDVVNDTIRELELEKTIVHLGNVRRKNISFDIALHDTDTLTTRVETAKMELTLNRIRDYVSKGEKVLAYFPYRSQVDAAYSNLTPREKLRIRRYHGQIPAPERKLTEQSYKIGQATGLVCTKAFGMGIDVEDIRHVVHFAPTGTLADYVQEIGRCARNPSIQGVAHIDYFGSDLQYVRTLNWISEMRQYQLREMLRKLFSIYDAKQRRNLLIASETFEYLFSEDEAENRTKSGLMLLSRDLNAKYAFPVLIVKPRAMLSKNYVCVPHEIEGAFLKQYGNYVKKQDGNGHRVLISNNQERYSDVEVYSIGDTYLADMEAIWENCYPDMAFGMFKKTFFEKEYFTGGKGFHISPRVRIAIRYTEDFDTVTKRVSQVLNALCDLFAKYKRGETKQFTQQTVETDLEEMLGEKVVSHDKFPLLLDIFTETVSESAAYTQSRNQIRVLRKRKQASGEDTVFYVSNPAYSRMPGFFQRHLSQCFPSGEDNVFCRFYPLLQNRPIELMPLLRLLELLKLARYEIRGGEKAEVFIRINDPQKLRRLAATNYKNNVLQMIQSRHKRNQELLSAFFKKEMSDDARWDLIEEYFLGNEDTVRQTLGLDE